MGKHAYMIMAHNQPELLKRLIGALDHERNDIFLHIDLKSDIDLEGLGKICVYSNVYFVERMKVFWGGYSQIRAEMTLLKNAVKTGVYDYYHLLTGVDFPLYPQNEILHFFDEHKGEEFIGISECRCLDRIQFYYPFQSISRRQSLLRGIRKCGIWAQKALHVNRIKRLTLNWGYGSAYFDITDGFARYLCGQEDMVHRIFKNTFCADEIFIQTMYLNAPRFVKGRRYQNPKQSSWINRVSLDVNRAIDFSRGNPYVFQLEDLEALLCSGCLFARKFDYEKYPKVIEEIERRVRCFRA